MYTANPEKSIHAVGFLLILVDFLVSGVPVRLLHFYQPLSFTLLYNTALLLFTYATKEQGPFYVAADYFSKDLHVRHLLSAAMVTRFAVGHFIASEA